MDLMHKCKISINTSKNQICLFTSTTHSPGAPSVLALQKSITFQPLTETKVNFEMPGPLANVLVEPHKDLDPDLHLMDGIIWSEWRLTVIAATVRIALVDILDLSEVDIPAGGFLYPAVGWG